MVVSHLKLVNVFIASLYLINFPVQADRIKSKIYKHLDSRYRCFRRLNATNQIGCSTKEGGNVGIVYMVREETDIDHIVETGQQYPYVPVLTAPHFTLPILSRFRAASRRVSGVLLLDRGVEALDSFSADKSCPNSHFGLYATNETYSHCVRQKWNLVADRDNDRIDDSLMFNDWPFPIFLIRNETNATELQDCFDNHSEEWPRCAVQLVAATYAAKDAKTCIRRSHMRNSPSNLVKMITFCSPLTAINIFSTLLETNKSVAISDKTIVVLATRLDSFSIFSESSTGIDSALSSLITLLSVAHTLSESSVKQRLKDISPENNLLFALIDGEAFDYIGSNGIVFDMNRDQFPVDAEGMSLMAQIRTNHFSHFIELNQLAIRDNADNYTLYVHKNVDSTQKTEQLLRTLQSNAEGMPVRFEATDDGQPLPPSSLQTFLKEDASLIGIVVTNHRKEYVNKFYNSFLDNFNRLKTNETQLITALTDISTVISRTVFDLLTASSPKKSASSEKARIKANRTVMKDLFQCYMVNSNCSLFNMVYDAVNPNKSFDTYVGSSEHSLYRRYTYRVLSYFTGHQVMAQTKADCFDDNRDQRFKYAWIPGMSGNGTCIGSSTVIASRTSPAFHNPKEVVNSSLYSTWTQSRPGVASVRLFLIASPGQQWLTLAVGLIFLIISIVIICLFKAHSKQIFNLADLSSTSSQSE